MTHPTKLAELLELTTASRHIAEHNAAEAERVGSYGEFGDSDMSGGIVGDKMAARLLGHSKPSKWEQEKAALAEQLAKERATTAANYRKLMSHGR